MLKQVTPLILVVAVSACSSQIDKRIANDSEKYSNHYKETPPLVIPQGLLTPNYSQEYEIPALPQGAENHYIGDKLDIRPPLQVLPMADGTRVEDSNNGIKIVIETIDNETNLKQEVYGVLEQFLKSKDYPIESADFNTGVIETGWITDSQVIDSNLFGSDEIYKVSQRYKFIVNIQPHGRTGDVEIQLIDHKEDFNGDKQDIALSNEDKRRYTVDMLNDAVAYLSIERNKAMKAQRIKDSLGIDIALVNEKDQQAYWVADAPFNKVWQRMRLVLPEMGLEIVDMDSSRGLMFVNATDDSGFWSSLWGDDTGALKEGSYRLQLDDISADKTKITISDKDNEPLANETVVNVYQTLSKLMQEKRKTR